MGPQGTPVGSDQAALDALWGEDKGEVWTPAAEEAANARQKAERERRGLGGVPGETPPRGSRARTGPSHENRAVAFLWEGRPLSTIEHLKSQGSGFLEGLAGVPGAMAQSGAILTEKLGGPDLREGANAYAQGVLDWAHSIAPPVRAVEAREALPIGQALGSSVGFLGLGAVGGAAGLPAWASTAFAGAMVNAAPAYYEALYATGGDEDKAFESFLKNGLVGLSEALPLARILGRVNRATGGSLQRALVDMAIEGGEEALQELGQQVAGNLIFSNVTGEERDVLEGVFEGGAAGFLSGVILSGLASAATGVARGGEDGQEAPPIQEGLRASGPPTEQGAISEMTPEEEARSAQLQASLAGESQGPLAREESQGPRPEGERGGLASSAPPEGGEATPAQEPVQAEEEAAVRGLQEIAGELPQAVAGVVSPELAAQAKEDALTGLANQGEDVRQTERALKERAPGQRVVRLRLDMDNFKALNDTQGHGAGNRALQAAAEAWKAAAREGDVVSAPSIARTGGDEFGATLVVAEGADAAAIARRLEEAVNRAIEQAGLGEAGGKRVGASVGFAEGLEDAKELDKAADAAASARKKERGVSKARGEEAKAAPDFEGGINSLRAQLAKTEKATVQRIGRPEGSDRGVWGIVSAEGEVLDRGFFSADIASSRREKMKANIQEAITSLESARQQAQAQQTPHQRRMESARSGEQGFRTFLQAHGGLRFEADLERYTPRESLERRAPGLSRLVQAHGSDKGLTIDEALEKAVEAGFFPGRTLDQLSKQDLIDLIESEGDKGALRDLEAEEERRAIRAYEAQEAEEIQRLIQDEGLSYEDARRTLDARIAETQSAWTMPWQEIQAWPTGGEPATAPQEAGLFGEQEREPGKRQEGAPVRSSQPELFIGQRDLPGQTYLPDVGEAGGAAPRGSVGFPGVPATIAPPAVPQVVTQQPIGRGLFGRLARPVTKAKGVNAPAIIDQLSKVVQALGRSGVIRVGVKGKRALGIFKVQPEVVRVRAANDIATAAHEIGHFLEKAVYGWPKGGPWRASLVDKTIQGELKDLGVALYGKTKPAGGYKREGWAEFIRLYVSEPASLPAKAPALTSWFTGTFLKSQPEVAAELERARSMIDEWRNMGSVERAKASIIDPASPMERLKRRYRDLRSFLSVQAWIEMGEPIRRMVEAAKERHGADVIRADGDPWLTYQALRTQHSAITRWMVERGMVDPAGNQVGPSLEEAVAPVRGRMDDFTLYLWAKQAVLYHTDPRGPREPGLSLEDAQQIISELDGPGFQIAANMLMAWNDGVLDYAAAASPSFAAVVKQVRDVHPGYLIPLQREFRTLDRLWGRSGSSPSAKSGSPVRRMKGSGRRIKNPIPALISHAEQIVLKSHQRMVLDRILRMSTIEGMGHLIEEVPKDQVPAAHATIEQIIQNVNRRLQAMHAGERLDLVDPLTGQGLLSQGMMGSGMDSLLGEAVTFFAPAATPKRGEDPVLPVYHEGQVRWYVVPEGLYRTLSGMDVYRMPAGLEILLGLPAQIMRAGTTGLRASFGLVTNPIRDIQTLYLNSASRASAPRLLAEWLKASLNAVVGVGTRGRVLNPWHEAFLRLGGEMSLPMGQDIPQTRRAARRLFQGVTGRILDPRNAFDTVRDLLQFPEHAPRVAEMKLIAKEIGWEPGQPMTLEQSLRLRLAFKQVTTDFTAAGEYARVWNRIAPFHNAAFQGPRANIRAARRNPARFVARGLQLTAATLGLWWLIKDEDWYEELPLKERFLYWHVPFEKDGQTEVVSIPRSFEVGGMFAALPEMLLDAWYRNEPEQVKSWFAQMGDLLFPNVEPVLFDELIDQVANKDRFWEMPIVPEGEKRRPPEEQYNEYTSRAAIKLGELFGVSPRRIDHAIRGVGGGVASDLVALLGRGPTGEKEDRESELADLPVIGRLFRRGGAMGTRPRSIDTLYEELEKAETRAASKKREETDEERTKRLLLGDATKAVSALAYVRSQEGGVEERRALLQEGLAIARDALRAIRGSDATMARFRFKESRRAAEARKDAVQ